MPVNLDLNLPNQRKYLINASLWKRALSFLIDFMIIDFFIISSFRVTVSTLFPERKISEMIAYLSNNPNVISQGMLILSIIGILSFYYLFYFQRNLGQTIGMRIMKLHVVSDKETELWQYLVRNLYILPIIPFIFISVIDLVYLIIFNKRFSEIITKSYLMEEHVI